MKLSLILIIFITGLIIVIYEEKTCNEWVIEKKPSYCYRGQCSGISLETGEYFTYVKKCVNRGQLKNE